MAAIYVIVGLGALVLLGLIASVRILKFLDAITHSGSMGMGFDGTNVDNQKIDQASEEAALKTATEGAERARPRGLSPGRESPAATAPSPHG